MYEKEIKNLALFCQDQKDMFHTTAASGFQNNCPHLLFHNRVFVENNVDFSDLENIKQHYLDIPYTIWLNKENSNAKNKLASNAVKFMISWPAMMLNVQTFVPKQKDTHLPIRLVESDEEIITTWIPLVMREYFPQLSAETSNVFLHDWKLFFTYLKNSVNYKKMYFYLGYWDNTPVATGLFITQNDALYIHWIGCLPEFRKRGIGSAMTEIPIATFKKQGVKKAFLFASEMGKSIYEKLGFSTVGAIDVYEERPQKK